MGPVIVLVFVIVVCNCVGFLIRFISSD